MILVFKLSMPNNNSWNGKWTGQDKHYLKVVNFGRSKKGIEKAKKILNVPAAQRQATDDSGSYYYNFGDGWGAGVSVFIVDGSKEAAMLRRKSDGFCNYDWMVDSIMDYGEILDCTGQKEAAQARLPQPQEKGK